MNGLSMVFSLLGYIKANLQTMGYGVRNLWLSGQSHRCRCFARYFHQIRQTADIHKQAAAAKEKYGLGAIPEWFPAVICLLPVPSIIKTH